MLLDLARFRGRRCKCRLRQQRGGEHRILGQRGDDDAPLPRRDRWRRAARPSLSSRDGVRVDRSREFRRNRSEGCARDWNGNAAREARRICGYDTRSFSQAAQGFKQLMARYPMRSSWRAYRPDDARPAAPAVARMLPGGSRAHPRARSGLASHRLRRHRLRGRHAHHRRAGLHRHLGRPARRSPAHHPRARSPNSSALHRPQEIAVERVFLSKNADSALKLGQARGAALAAVPAALGVHEYAPRAIKLAVVGVGGAEKAQVAHMVKQLLAHRDEARRRMPPTRWRSPSATRIPALERRRDDRVIGFVRGKLAIKAPPHLTVDVGGVGYDIEAPMSTFYTLPARRQRRAPAHASGRARRRAHPLRLRHRRKSARCSATCSRCRGVGPKIALAILSGVSVEGFATLREAARTRPRSRKIPGVGRKTAERCSSRCAIASMRVGASGGRRRAVPTRQRASKAKPGARWSRWATSPPKSRRCSSRSPGRVPARPKT